QGHIEVKSTLGKGSTFSLTLKLPISNTIINQEDDSVYANNLQQLTKLQCNHTLLQAIHNTHILLVEDNTINQLIIAELLKKLGLNVTIANNGYEAIQQALNHDYDAILMDLQMPEMDGLEATRRIRASKHGQNIPIIAVTAAAMTEDQQACQNAGMNDFITKPIEIATLTNVLLRWIKPTTTITPPTTRTVVPVEDSFTIPGLDLIDAVKRLDGNWNMLRQILRSFANGSVNSASDLESQITQNCWTDAFRLVHTIKGLANTIGARDLYRISVNLETELKDETYGSITKFKTILTNTLNAINTLEPPDAQIAPVSTNIERLQTLLNEVQLCINNSAFVKTKTLDELASTLTEPDLAIHFRNLRAHLEAFNYKYAQYDLLNIAARCNITIESF
ncbi:hypothetical protein TI03_02765, partial [Achromatium sp. WMS1]